MKFRLQFWNSATLGVLSIRDIGNKNYFLRAIQSETDVQKHKEENLEQNEYTHPMTMKEIQLFIIEDTEKRIGREAKDCIGLCLEDLHDELITFE